jgi:glyoxylate reductase
MAVDHGTATVGAYLTISALRQFHRAEVNVRNGKWKSGLAPARDPQGKVLGIIGMGGIGSVSIAYSVSAHELTLQTMAKMLIPFDMTVIYYNRKEITPAPDFPCEYVSSQEELLKRADVVSLNLPLNEKTKGSFGREQFKQMKDGSVLINTARGAVVDEEAFLEALDSGKVGHTSDRVWR